MIDMVVMKQITIAVAQSVCGLAYRGTAAVRDVNRSHLGHDTQSSIEGPKDTVELHGERTSSATTPRWSETPSNGASQAPSTCQWSERKT